MPFYFIIFFIVCIACAFAAIGNRPKKIAAIVIAVMLIVIAGLRLPGIDRDSATYDYVFSRVGAPLDYFTHFSDYSFYEAGYYLVPSVFKTFFNVDTVWCFLFFAILGVFLKFRAIWKLTEFQMLSVLVYFCHFFILHEMTQIREGVASGVLLLCVVQIEKKNFIAFLSLLFVGFFFHYSSLIFIPFYFLNPRRLNKKIYFTVLLVPNLLYLLGINIINIFISLHLGIISDKLTLYNDLLEAGIFTDINVYNSVFLIETVFCAFLIWKCDFFYTKNKYALLLIKIYSIALGSWVLFASIPVISFRSYGYLGIVEIILVPFILYYIEEESIALVFTFLFALVSLFIDIVHNELLAPYKTVVKLMDEKQSIFFDAKTKTDMKASVKKVAIKTTVAVVLCLVCGICFSQRTTIVSNSKSGYHIVVSANAPAIEKEAADTLQAYFLRISNCNLPITNEAANTNASQLIIGNSGILQTGDMSGLQEDGVLIKKINSAIIFGGGHRKGVLYSVYTFLDSVLNCKLYAYNVSYIPKTKTIAVPSKIYIKQAPAFNYRMSGFINLTKSYCDFNKQNYFYEDWGLWVHSFDVLVPAKTYFVMHPEYFALVDSKRTPDQLCLSNPDVLQLVITNLSNQIKEHPELKYWSVSQNDNELFCQCDACKKLDAEQGSHQGSILTFVNAVAKHFPDKTITTLAYLYSQKPPATLKPASNVMIMLCNIYGERSRPIMGYGANQFNTDLRGWQTLTTNIFVWEYVVQFSHSMSPFPNLYVLQPNVKYFKERKIPYLFEEGFVNQPAEFSELRTYLISKLMWNESADVKSIIHNFITVYYGNKSAQYIEQYINLLYANSLKSNARLYIFGAPADQKNTYLTQDDIDSYKTIFQKALSRLNENDVYYKRVAKEYLSVLFAELDVNGAHKAANSDKDITDKTALKNKLDTWYALTKKLNIAYISEDYKTVDEYYQRTSQLLHQ